MHITVTGRHMEITPAIRDYIEDKILKLDRYSPKIIEAHVIAGHEKYRFIVEVVLIGTNLRISAKEETNDFHGAVDIAFSKIVKRLKRSRDIIKEKHKGGRFEKREARYAS